jgi:hypothetical protein
VLEIMANKKEVMNMVKGMRLGKGKKNGISRVYNEEWHQRQTLNVHSSEKSAWTERTRKMKGVMAQEPEVILFKSNHITV